MMRTLFIPCHSEKNSIPVVKKALRRLQNYGRIGILTTAQHTNQLKEISNFLKKNGKEAVIGGQVLGCDQSSAKKIENKVDAFLYIGSGKFHPLGISLATEKPVIIANPYSDSVDEIPSEERKKYLGRRRGQIARAISGETFGILISTKTKQLNLELALKIKEKLEKKNKKAFLFSGDEITPENLLGFKVDAWINTACPRLIENYFDKPVLNPNELEFL